MRHVPGVAPRRARRSRGARPVGARPPRRGTTAAARRPGWANSPSRAAPHAGGTGPPSPGRTGSGRSRGCAPSSPVGLTPSPGPVAVHSRRGHPTTHAPPPPTDGPVGLHGVRVSTRGDYTSRALLSLALHGRRITHLGPGYRGTAPPSPSPIWSRSCWRSRAPDWSARSGVSVVATCSPDPGGDLPRPDRLGRRRSHCRGRLRGAARKRRVRPRGPVRPAGGLGGRGRDDPHPAAVLQPGRHGRSGPGRRGGAVARRPGASRVILSCSTPRSPASRVPSPGRRRHRFARETGDRPPAAIRATAP